MTGFCSWSVLVLYFCSFCLIQGTHGQDKGLIATTFASYGVPGKIEVFPGDPSTYQKGQIVNATKMDFDQYAQLISAVPNIPADSLLILNAKDHTIYNYEHFDLKTLNSSNEKHTKIFTGVSATLGHIAVDWLAGNVYFTDSYYDWIAVHPLRFQNGTNSMKVLVHFMVRPEAIAVDPIKRYLFWSELKNARCRITRSNLAGDKDTLIDIVKLEDKKIHISAIALDSENERVYFSDMSRDSIEYVDYSRSSGIQVLTKMNDAFLDIALAPSVLCGTEYSSFRISCFGLNSKEETWFTFDDNEEPWALTYWDADKQKTPAHACQNNACDHICINTGESDYKCLCREGYKLKTDGRGCESIHGLLYGKAVIVASETSFCMYDIHVATSATPKPDCVFTQLTGLEHFVVDSNRGIFYYYDGESSSIKLVDMVSQTQRTIVSNTGEKVTGMTYDWINNMIYWTAGSKIQYHTTDHNAAPIDLFTNLDRPKYVTINPHIRKLYWIEGARGDNVLREGKTDGTALSDFALDHTYTIDSNALTYDVTSDRLFWNEEDSLVSVMIDGKSPTFHEYSGKIPSLAIYQDYGYYPVKDNVLEISYLYAYRVEHVNVTYMKTIKAVGIYDKALQPPEKNNCTNFNGGCEHVCIPTGVTTMRCVCDFGYTLQEDGKECATRPFLNNFALLPDQDHHVIHQVSTINGEVRTLDIPEVDQPMSVIYDDYSKKIYWTNEWYSEIMSFPLNGTGDEEPEQIFGDWFSEPIGLAFDYSSGLLYFTTEEFWWPGYIACIHPQVGNSVIKTLIHGTVHAQSIALYPSKGIMFWTDVPSKEHQDQSYIGVADMNGENEGEIVTTDIKSPDGIVIDYATDKVYWADVGKSTIEYADLDGSNRNVLMNQMNAGLVGLDISPPYLYYVGRNKQRIGRYDMSQMQSMPFMNDIHQFGKIESVRVYPEQPQPINQGCSNNNGGCELFCLPKNGGHDCACPDYDSLLDDGKSCRDHITCNKNIPNAVLEKRCLAHASGTCDYSCGNGYDKTVDKLVCDERGNWNHPIHTVCENVLGTCDPVVPHGHMSPDCTKRINAVCTYKCITGYIENPSIPTITCLKTSAWSKPVDKLCTPLSKPCPTTLRNAVIDPKCKITSGMSCDYTCNNGWQKMEGFSKLVCLGDGEWSHNGEVCRPAQQCDANIPNGAFEQDCVRRIGDYCMYMCNPGYVKNNVVEYLRCEDTRRWNYGLQNLCMKEYRPCDKSQMKNGAFASNCKPKHGEYCDYSCATGYIKNPDAIHMICHDGSWTLDTDYVCVERPPEAQSQDVVAPAAVVGGTFAAVIITAIVVLVLVFLIYTMKCKGNGASENTNIRFKRFEDPQPPAQKGITEFSNPMASQQQQDNNGWTTASVKAPPENVYQDLKI